MAEERKVNYALLFSVLVTLVGYGVTFGTCQNRITNIEQQLVKGEQQLAKAEKQHAMDIDKLDSRQVSTDALLNNINTQLVELNTKVSLLITGKLQLDQ